MTCPTSIILTGGRENSVTGTVTFLVHCSAASLYCTTTLVLPAPQTVAGTEREEAGTATPSLVLRVLGGGVEWGGGRG